MSASYQPLTSRANQSYSTKAEAQYKRFENWKGIFQPRFINTLEKVDLMVRGLLTINHDLLKPIQHLEAGTVLAQVARRSLGYKNTILKALRVPSKSSQIVEGWSRRVSSVKPMSRTLRRR